MSNEKTKHAPWQVGHKRPFTSEILWPAVFDSRGELVAYVDDAADAPLIAASPGLLRLLKEFVAEVKQHSNSPQFEHMGPLVLEAERQIEAAS